MNLEEFTLGVEEEFQILDARTRELRSRAERILDRARKTAGESVQPELYLSQVEIGTPVCCTLGEVRAELLRLRKGLIMAAGREGSLIAAAGTHPFSHWNQQRLTPSDRYLEIAEDYQQLAREHLIFGCHVHVGVSDREMALKVMNRSRPWLPCLLALSANSPFWLGFDTGYASFRTEVWRRWPMAGAQDLFASEHEYEELVQSLVQTGSISDESKIYWDVRPSSRFQTVEFRVADVCLTVDEAVMMAGLTRALVKTCVNAKEDQALTPSPRSELIRVAKWRAARYGLDQELIDFKSLRLAPAADVVEGFLSYIREALEEFGDRDEINSLVLETLRKGTGAKRQRAEYAQSERMEDVVDYITRETRTGVVEARFSDVS